MPGERFERLYDEHAQGLLAYVAYRTGDRALAEDIVADTFERALKARRRFDWRRGGERAWLYTIARNLVRDHQRRQVVEERALERVGTPGEDLDSSLEDSIGDRDAVMGALDCLSAEERESIALRFGAQLSVPEIAKLTKERLTTVEGRVYRALRKLREELD